MIVLTANHIMILSGIAAVVCGVLLRLGRLRKAITVWDNRPDMPSIWRNGAYGWIPTGIGFVLLGTSGLLREIRGGPGGLGVLVSVVGFVCFFVALAIQADPPDGVKPEWRKEQERSGRRES